MCAKRWLGKIILLLSAVAWATAVSFPIQAATFEEEEMEDEDLLEAPTPVPAKARSVTAPATPAAVSKKVLEPTSAEDLQETKADSGTVPRVRINRNVSFYYFLRAGHVIADSSEVPSLGEVVDASGELGYSTPKKITIRLASSATEVKAGDLWVVYRATDRIQEPKSKLSAFWVRNLAVVKVLEVQKQRCQVEVQKTFWVFKNGDKVKLYDGEIQRWKDAHVKKPLPAQPIRCRVAGGEPNHDYLTETDFIILDAGSKKGIVEGQIFELRNSQETGFLEKPLQILRGKAQVFYAGADYAMARILKSSVTIQKGFEAIYQP